MTEHEYVHDPARWDEATLAYAEVAEPLTTPYGLDALDALGPRPGERLLDVAAGPGATARAAARRGLDVTAVDFSPGMVAHAAARAAAEGLTNFAARAMDGQALDLLDGVFDLAVSTFGVFLFPDHRAGLSEIRRVLRPGGRAAIVSWSAPERMEFLAVWADAVRADWPAFPGFRRPPGVWAMSTPDGLAAEMDGAGFKEIEVRPLRHEWVVRSPGWLAENGDRSPMFIDLYDRLGPGSRDRVRGRLLAALQGRHGDAPFALAGEAWLGLGTA